MRDVVDLVLLYLTLIISLVVLCIEVWALVVALILPGEGYRAAGKATKPAWAAGLTVVVALNLLLSISPLGMLGLIMVIVAGVFLADVKPAVQEVLRSSSRRGKGPLGLW